MGYFCNKCGKKEVKQKYLKRIKGNWLCKKCYSENRKEHREFIKRDIAGIRTKNQQMEDWKKKREEKEKLIIEERKGNIIPIIKNNKINKRIKISELNYNDKSFLYNKKIKQGKSKEEIKEDLENINKKIKKINSKKYQDRFKDKKQKKDNKTKFLEGLK